MFYFLLQIISFLAMYVLISKMTFTKRRKRRKIAIQTQLLQISNSKYSHEKKNPNQTSKNFPYKFSNVLYWKEKNVHESYHLRKKISRRNKKPPHVYITYIKKIADYSSRNIVLMQRALNPKIWARRSARKLQCQEVREGGLLRSTNMVPTTTKKMKYAKQPELYGNTLLHGT